MPTTSAPLAPAPIARASIVAEPLDVAVTSPVEDTDAIVGASDTHVIVGVTVPPVASVAVALSCVVVLTAMLVDAGVTATDATGAEVTVKSDESLSPPGSVATT